MMGNFTFTQMDLPGMVLVEPRVFGDDRGFFLESWRADAFAAGGVGGPFVQDNHSKSRRGVLRGLHYQRQNTQGKLVRVIQGSVFDVGVDLRPNSPHFGRWAAAELSAENKKMLYVPPGFAHGFLVLSDEAEFLYKCTDYYNPAAEGGIAWNDPDIGIAWPDAGTAPMMSDKDAALPPLAGQDFDFFKRWYTP